MLLYNGLADSSTDHVKDFFLVWVTMHKKEIHAKYTHSFVIYSMLCFSCVRKETLRHFDMACIGIMYYHNERSKVIKGECKEMLKKIIWTFHIG